MFSAGGVAGRALRASRRIPPHGGLRWSSNQSWDGVTGGGYNGIAGRGEADFVARSSDRLARSVPFDSEAARFRVPRGDMAFRSLSSTWRGSAGPVPIREQGCRLGATAASAAEARRARTFETGPRAEGTVFSDAQPRERSVGARDAVVEDPSRPRWRRDPAEHGGWVARRGNRGGVTTGFDPARASPGPRAPRHSEAGRTRHGRKAEPGDAKRTAIYIEIRRAVRYRDEARVGSVTSSEGVGRFSSGKHSRGPNHHVTRRPYPLADA